MGGPAVTCNLEANRETILAEYQTGATVKQLSKKYNCSNTPIRRFLIKNGVAIRKVIKPKALAGREGEVETLYRNGASPREIAQRLGVNRNTVTATLKTLGILRGVGLKKRSFHIHSDADKGILAGLLLGEGSIIIRGRGASVRIVNQDAAILGWLSKFGGKIYWTGPRERVPNPCGVWDLSGAVDVFHCLVTIHPLLVGKKRNLARAAITVLRANYGLKEIP